MKLDRIINQGEIYKDLKGNLYQIVAVAHEDKTMKKVVVYQALYGSFEYYTSEFEDFVSVADEKNYKFELVNTKELRKSDDIYIENFLEEESIEEHSVEKQNVEADIMMLTENVNCAKSEQIRQGRTKEELLRFLESDYYKDKIEVITYMNRNNLLTSSILIDMAVSIDCVLEDGTLEEQYDSIVKCLKTMARYQSRRLREIEILVK